MKKEKSSPLEPILCTAQRLEAIAKKYIFQPTGLSETGMLILRLLKENKTMIVSDLLEKVGTTKSNMSQRLSVLEKEGYITKVRKTKQQDRRRMCVTLTKVGEQKIDDLEKRIRKARISLEKKFSQEELDQHKVFFEKLNHILDNGECMLSKIFNNNM